MPEYRFESFGRRDPLSRQVARRQGWELATYRGVAVFHHNDGLVGHLEYFDGDDALHHGVRAGEFNLALDDEDRLHHSDELSDDARDWIMAMGRRHCTTATAGS